MSKQPQKTIAIVYDFDGTLMPGNMQEPTIFEHYGIKASEFWGQAEKLVLEQGYERTLAYLKLLIDDERFSKEPLTPQFLRELAAKKITYFEGVEEYFDYLERAILEIREVRDLGIVIEHYIVSSGMSELVKGCSIAKYFKKIYACDFAYEDDRPVFPKLVINDTNKTQFLFRINKGKLDLAENINSHMREEDRPIPFRNMVYIGDGLTDIPSMTVVQKSGGHAIAVFDPTKKVPLEVEQMVQERRADHLAPADYRNDKLLVKIIHKAIRKIVHDIAYRASSKMSKDWVEDVQRTGSSE
ncbi:MAG: hypothetical protein ACI9CF_000098 [Candidatus Omnitrophota bacterium]